MLLISSDIRVFEGKTFGTYYRVKARTTQNLHPEIRAVFKQINIQMSVFNPRSEINSINKEKQTEVSDELLSLLKTSHKIWKETNGAFDPTVGDLVELWGFGVNKQHNDVSEKEIKTILKYSGFDKISFKGNVVVKKDVQTHLNLSAIAKGYAVDKVAEMLEAKGVHNYVVDIGGEVRAKGVKNYQKEPWKIGLAKPNNPLENAMSFDLKDMSVATSGDYHNFFVKKNKKYSHTIDPKTGYPVNHNLASVTVFHKSAMIADAYATALMVMGEKNGRIFAQKHKIKAIFWTHNDEVFHAD